MSTSTCNQSLVDKILKTAKKISDATKKSPASDFILIPQSDPNSTRKLLKAMGASDEDTENIITEMYL